MQFSRQQYLKYFNLWPQDTHKVSSVLMEIVKKDNIIIITQNKQNTDIGEEEEDDDEKIKNKHPKRAKL